MLDFKAELDKLISMEEKPLPDNESAEMLALFSQKQDELNRSQTGLSQKQDDISMQVEEIYDIVKNADNSELTEALRNEKRRSERLESAVMGLCDIIEDFHVYASRNDDEALARQALLMWRNTSKLLDGCGVARINEAGEAGFPFDPAIHRARAAEPSAYPRESVINVLRSGYRSAGEVRRKADVVVSAGDERQDLGGAAPNPRKGLVP